MITMFTLKYSNWKNNLPTCSIEKCDCEINVFNVIKKHLVLKIFL